MKNKKYIKSPINYTGGKYKLLEQILPLFPDRVDTFVDLFGGGFNVGVNVEADKIIYNDIDRRIVEIFEYFKTHSTDDLLDTIHKIINIYNLSKTNREGFLQLREYYNKRNKSPILLYMLICHAFNYQIRFNKKGEYNMPFGKDRSSFNPSLEKRFIEFVNRVHSIDVDFLGSSFTDIDFNCFGKDDLIYCDPPYYNSTATYNENGGWTDKNELDLLKTLDNIHSNGVKFALSNNLKLDNPILEKWKDKYNVHYLNGDYSNCNYQKKDKSKDIEVLITNY